MKRIRFNQKTLSTVAIEFLSVVFAVLLALGLNHWRENYINNKSAKKLFTNVIEELNTNKIELTASIKEFDSLIKDLNSDQKALLANGRLNRINWSYSHPVLRSTAWETLSMTGKIEYLDTDEILGLSDIYSVLNMYDSFGYDYFKNVPEFRKYDREQEIALNIIITQITISRSIASQLLEMCNKYLENRKQ